MAESMLEKGNYNMVLGYDMMYCIDATAEALCIST